MNFTTEIEIKINYEMEQPEPDVGFPGGICMETPELTEGQIRELEEKCLEHYAFECDKEEALRNDYYDALRETSIFHELEKKEVSKRETNAILKEWNKLEGR